MSSAQPFLRIPPFPGHRAGAIAERREGPPADSVTAAGLADLLRRERVGGSFWGAQPDWPKERDLILAPSSNDQAADMVTEVKAAGLTCRAVMLDGDGGDDCLPRLAGPVDPWHLVEQSSEIWTDAGHELAVVATLAGTRVKTFGGAGLDAKMIASRIDREWNYRCPYDGRPITAYELVELLGQWRRLIDGNRAFAGVFGVAPWKRTLVEPLLWDGSGPVRHLRRSPGTGAKVIAWKSRTPARTLIELEQHKAQIAEIEDGMIRGAGLGANCVPPLSIIVDRGGIYFDPDSESDLERCLFATAFDQATLERAARLRARIVDEGVSKYGVGQATKRERDNRRSILVVGQVEDDRSVTSGGASKTNWELLARARSLEPHARLIYRPHPDVDAGHRKGHIPDPVVLRVADGIDRHSPITELIGSVDAVHVLTSLAGFEALLRGTAVTTHGMPFYAGWGLTTDLQGSPIRRGRRLSIDQLVAATLILYPRYVDPVTRLPCSPEILLDRIASGRAGVPAPLSPIRKLQGRFRRTLRDIQEATTG